MSRTICLIATRDDGYRAEARLTGVPDRPDMYDLALIESLSRVVTYAGVGSDGPDYDAEIKRQVSAAVEWSPSRIVVEFGAGPPRTAREGARLRADGGTDSAALPGPIPGE